MSLALSSFMRDLGGNPHAVAEFRRNPVISMTRAGLDADDIAAVSSGLPTAINSRIAHALGISSEVADDINVIVVVTGPEISNCLDRS